MSLDQASTVTDFQYRMALENLAMFRTNKNSLPWHVELTSGTAQLDESVSPTASFQWPPTLRTISLTGSHQITVNWLLTPVNNDEQLGALRERYRTETADPKFSTYYGEGDHPPSDLPHGCYRKRCVWPQPEQFDHFVQLILGSIHDMLTTPADEARYKKNSPERPGVSLTPR